MLFGQKTTMVTAEDALPGRDTPMRISDTHAVLGTRLKPPFPDGMEQIVVAMGCFWGAERIFWQLPGVYTTAVGYMGGWTRNPTYEETCTARTGHTESVLVVYDPTEITVGRLMKAFWENHDPTTPNRQGNDIGTQYRSAVFPTTREQLAEVEDSRRRYQAALTAGGFDEITTQISLAAEAGDGNFYYAEEYHQAYLRKNPGGYCNHGFCQVDYDLAAHGQSPAAAALPDD